jgi:hypothetical protein
MRCNQAAIRREKMNMNTRQQAAADFFRSFLNAELSRQAKEDHGAKITEWEVKPTEYGAVWISAEVELTALPEGNLLRALDHQRWFVLIGKGGSVHAHLYPGHYKQFKNKKRTFGVCFK